MSTNYIERVTTAMRSLFLSSQLSDLTIKCADCNIPTHKVFLYMMGENWGPHLDAVNELNWSHINQKTTENILKFIYTGEMPKQLDCQPLLLLPAAAEFKLTELKSHCEEILMEDTSPENCIAMFKAALESEAAALRKHAVEVAKENWCDIRDKHGLREENPQTQMEMVVAACDDPIHQAVLLGVDVLKEMCERRDVVLALINSPNKQGCFPLETALVSKLWEEAAVLVQHKANVNEIKSDSNGMDYLQWALANNDTTTAMFLIDSKADLLRLTRNGDNYLHQIAKSLGTVHDGSEGDVVFYQTVAPRLIESGVDPNELNFQGWSPLHLAIESGNTALIRVLLEGKNTDVHKLSKEGRPPLYYAYKEIRNWEEIADLLIGAGANLNGGYQPSNDSLLQLLITCAEDGSWTDHLLHLGQCMTAEEMNHQNEYGETALHLALAKGMCEVAELLLKSGADPDIQTTRDRVGTWGHGNTCLHYGAILGQTEALNLILNKQKTFNTKINVNIRNSEGSTVLTIAGATRCISIVPELIRCGADVNERDNAGLTALHKAILQKDSDMAVTLLREGADVNAMTGDEQHPMHMAIERNLDNVVDLLCQKGADTSVRNKDGQVPMAAALNSNQLNIVRILTSYGVDTDAWSIGPDGSYQTLLHAAIDNNSKEAAIFLIKSGCDINSPRRSSLEAGSREIQNAWTPLHMCCQSGLEDIAEALLEHGASVNKKDADGKTPLHLAVENKQENIVNLLLRHPNIDVFERDSRGNAPFAVAVSEKFNKAASAILEKFPTVAEQFNKKGLNILHTTLETNDLASVLFLLSINVDVNSISRDATRTPPLHLAAKGGNEVIIRSLTLTGAKVDAVDAYRQTALHVATAYGHTVAMTALLSQGVDPDAVDNDGNNALHIACKEGQLSAVRLLVEESSIKVEALNNKGQNPLHVLARYGKESAYAICNLLTDLISDISLDRPDVDGNTPLLIAYMKGNGNLCRALVKVGASLGAMNQEGITIFNYHVATKQLLHSILEYLDKEPRWCEGGSCLECGTKFSLTMRRHHCRHCGRLLCSKCSDQDVAIIKYKLNKPVRVCEVCFLVLQGGAA